MISDWSLCTQRLHTNYLGAVHASSQYLKTNFSSRFWHCWYFSPVIRYIQFTDCSLFFWADVMFHALACCMDWPESFGYSLPRVHCTPAWISLCCCFCQLLLWLTAQLFHFASKNGLHLKPAFHTSCLLPRLAKTINKDFRRIAIQKKSFPGCFLRLTSLALPAASCQHGILQRRISSMDWVHSCIILSAQISQW